MSKKIFVIIGAPGSGKGTSSEIISEKFDIPHISIGTVIRKNREDIINDKNSNYNKGKLTSDSIVQTLLINELDKINTSKGYILDGYPRTIKQVKILEEILKARKENITKVFLFDASLDLIYSRTLSRKICKNCNKVFKPSDNVLVGDKCPKCFGKIILRTDDNEKTLKNRIDTFFSEITPIKKYYDEQGILEIIDARQASTQISKKI